jgi:hypothetical protein
VTTSWDIGVRDATAIWFYQQHGNNIHMIDYYEATGVGLPHYVKILQDKGYTYREHIAPHDIKAREWAGGAQTRTAVAQELGITFRPLERILVRMGSEVAEGIDAARRVLPRCHFDEANCREGISALENYKRKRNRSTGELTDTPDHNWASHGADAFRYFALGLRQVAKANRPAQKTSWIV